MPASIDIVEGNLLDQPVDVIVNAWNRNFIPWWLLIPHGVSGAIKKRGGYQPFREVGTHGVLPLGGAVLTSAGRLPFKGIIHVAGIGFTWTSSPRSVRESVRNALAIAQAEEFASIAFPLIGAGTGGGSPKEVLELMTGEAKASSYPGRVVIVKYRRA